MGWRWRVLVVSLGAGCAGAPRAPERTTGWAAAQDVDADVARDVRALAFAPEEPHPVDVEVVTARVAAAQGRALAPIEIVMSSAPAHGRSHLVVALGRIADPGAAGVLERVALADPSPEVRAQAVAVLERCAAEAGPRGARARGALEDIEQVRRGERLVDLTR